MDIHVYNMHTMYMYVMFKNTQLKFEKYKIVFWKTRNCFLKNTQFGAFFEKYKIDLQKIRNCFLKNI